MPERTSASRARPRALVTTLVDTMAERIRSGEYRAGERLGTEAAIMREFDVSRTVVREALSRLQASGLVDTRHGIGSFVSAPGDGASFRIVPDELATLRDVVCVLELRIGVESEAASLAARRRNASNIASLRSFIDAFVEALDRGEDAVEADYGFHLEVARATQNPRFSDLMATFGPSVIPRARLRLATQRRVSGGAGAAPGAAPGAESNATYLHRVNAEHESILLAIENGDPEAARAAMRTHLVNSRERRRRSADASDVHASGSSTTP